MILEQRYQPVFTPKFYLHVRLCIKLAGFQEQKNIFFIQNALAYCEIGLRLNKALCKLRCIRLECLSQTISVCIV
jgi:hypothetical protein